MNHLPEFLALLQVMLIDLSMAGDNALVLGMAAAGLPVEKRHRAVIAGVIGATVLRIIFALFAVQILHFTGLLVAGGLLLLWVAWKMYWELRHSRTNGKPGASGNERKSLATLDSSLHENDFDSANKKKLSTAIWQIIVADVSMSLDNVLGVAGVARDHLWILAAGLSLSVLLMGIASTLVARLAARYSWIGYLGLAVVLYTALKMIEEGIKVII